MPGVSGPEGELHAHDYRVEVIVERRELDERGMVCDLDLLEEALGEIIAEVDGQDLEQIRPKGTEAVTVEVFASWVHAGLADALREGNGDVLSVRVWESADAFGGYRAPLAIGPGPGQPRSRS
jgi:6-pyruvoyltetrahydropterin/6-carboxytetrahydropterin synthase